MNRIFIRPLRMALLVLWACFPSPAMSGDLIYYTQKGDTLWDLCIQHSSKRGCWLELGKLNHIPNDRAIPVGTPIRFPLAWLINTPVVGVVTSSQGEAFYDRRDTGEQAALSSGDDIHLGAKLITGAGSIRFRLGERGELLLRANSELLIDSMTSSGEKTAAELQLNQGDIEVEVTPGRGSRFEIKTPAAIAAVRGTRFRVNSNSDQTMRSEVLHGAVAVESSSSITVPAGFGLAAKKGEPLLKPRKLPPAPALPSLPINSPLPVTITWSTQPDAIAWQVDLISTDSSEELLQSVHSTSPQLTFSSLDEGCYIVAVRATDNAGFNGLDATQSLCIVPPPPPPIEPEPDSLWPAILSISLLILIALL